MQSLRPALAGVRQMRGKLAMPASCCSFSSCAALQASTSSSASASSTSTTAPAFNTNRRFHDSLSGPSAPNARHYLLKDNPLVRLTVRPAPSPIPSTLPTVLPTAPASRSGNPAAGGRDAEVALPPRMHPEPAKRAVLSPEEIEQMRALRLSNPTYWTRNQLARKYNVSPLFVAFAGFGKDAESRRVARSVTERHEMREQRMRNKFGLRKRITSAIRRMRKQHW